jgi:dolichol-phosphate mannosyltransferase
MDDNFISIVIPTYNEKDNIIPLVERLSKTLADRNFEILLVDDNSKDGTVDMAASMAEKFPVKVMVRTKERGLATAVLHGIKYAQGNIIGVMDADLQHPPEINAALLKALDEGADMAIGSRYVPKGLRLWPIFFCLQFARYTTPCPVFTCLKEKPWGMPHSSLSAIKSYWKC